MDLFTNAKVSPVGKVNKADIMRWGNNLLIFLAPLVLLYSLQLYVTLKAHTLGFADLIPSAETVGGIQLYILNAVVSLFTRFTDPKK